MGGYAIPPISSPPHFLRGGVGSLVSQRTKEPCRSEVLVFSCFLPTGTYAHRPDKKYDTIDPDQQRRCGNHGIEILIGTIL